MTDVEWFLGNEFQIIKETLNYISKVYWPLVRYQWDSTSNENVLYPNRTTLLASIIEGYEINILGTLWKKSKELNNID